MAIDCRNHSKQCQWNGMEMNGSQVPVRSVPMQVPELILNSSEVPLEEPEVGEALPCFEDKMWPLN